MNDSVAELVEWAIGNPPAILVCVLIAAYCFYRAVLNGDPPYRGPQG